MTQDQLELLVKARDSLVAADLLESKGLHGFAVSRAYYAMFYVAEAFLEGEGMAFSKHSAVISAFGQHFAKTERVPREFHRHLARGLEARQQGDYGAPNGIDAQTAAEHIQHARDFLRPAEDQIGPIPPRAEDSGSRG